MDHNEKIEQTRLRKPTPTSMKLPMQHQEIIHPRNIIGILIPQLHRTYAHRETHSLTINLSKILQLKVLNNDLSHYGIDHIII